MSTDSVEFNITRLSAIDRRADIRRVPVEAPVSVEFNGIGYAVMMATPIDLEDFVTGFALSETVVRSIDEIQSVSICELEKGWVARVQISRDRIVPLLDRVRTRVSESSCGLCGLDNLDQVSRALPPITARLEVCDEALFKALGELRVHQPLNASTGGVHVAAFCSVEGEILMAREDVGRHTALDKLIGASARHQIQPSSGFFLLSSRCSYELVEKTVIAGYPLIVTISTATSLAVDRAREAGLRLVALARSDAMLDFSSDG